MPSPAQCSSPAASSPPPTTPDLQHPAASQAAFSSSRAPCPVTRALTVRTQPLNSPNPHSLPWRATRQGGTVQLGWGHSDPCGFVHHVSDPQSFQRHLMPHSECQRESGFFIASCAMWQSPVAITVALEPTSSRSRTLLGMMRREPLHQRDAGGLLPLWGQRDLIRDPVLLDAGGRCREMEADAGGSSRNELVLLPLLPAAAHPLDRSLGLCQKALPCIRLQKKGPAPPQTSLALSRVTGGCVFPVPFIIISISPCSLSFIPSQTK